MKGDNQVQECGNPYFLCYDECIKCVDIWARRLRLLELWQISEARQRCIGHSRRRSQLGCVLETLK